jgi:hypothetical protein
MVMTLKYVYKFCTNAIYKSATANMAMVRNLKVMSDKFDVDRMCT